MRRGIFGFATFFLFISTFGGVENLKAQQRYKIVHIFQKKRYTTKGKLEITPLFGITINDIWKGHKGTLGEVNYHITEDISIEVSGGYLWSKNTALFRDIHQLELESQTPNTEMKYFVHAGLFITPIYGKFRLFNLVTPKFDIFMGTGAGIVNVTLEKNYTLPKEKRSIESIKPSFYFGGGFRIFVFKWLGLKFEVKDYIYADRDTSPLRKGLEFPKEERRIISGIYNNVFFMIGTTFLLPP